VWWLLLCFFLHLLCRYSNGASFASTSWVFLSMLYYEWTGIRCSGSVKFFHLFSSWPGPSCIWLTYSFEKWSGCMLRSQPRSF
jgi:hypothetical protein